MINNISNVQVARNEQKPSFKAAYYSNSKPLLNLFTVQAKLEPIQEMNLILSLIKKVAKGDFKFDGKRADGDKILDFTSKKEGLYLSYCPKDAAAERIVLHVNELGEGYIIENKEKKDFIHLSFNNLRKSLKELAEKIDKTTKKHPTPPPTRILKEGEKP